MKEKGDGETINEPVGTENASSATIAVLEDLQNQLLVLEKDEQSIRERHRKEITPFLNRKSLIIKAIENLLEIYPNQKKGTQRILATFTVNSNESSADATGREASTAGEIIKGKQGSEGRRPAGFVKSTIIGAIKSLDAPVKAETVIKFIIEKHSDSGLFNSDIYTGLKDCRKNRQIVAIKTYRYNNLVLLNCLPSFFMNLDNSFELKPEYRRKLDQIMLDNDLKWEEEY